MVPTPALGWVPVSVSVSVSVSIQLLDRAATACSFTRCRERFLCLMLTVAPPLQLCTQLSAANDQPPLLKFVWARPLKRPCCTLLRLHS